jgi:hypothetical protein
LKLQAKARRIEVCSFKVCGESADEVKRHIRESTAGKFLGEFGKSNLGIVGDFACLPDGASRPWCRPPVYTTACGRARLDGSKAHFDEEDNTHVMLFMFDAGREGNRIPIRKHLACKDESDPPKEFFLHTTGRGKGHATKTRGVGTAGDIECMFVASRKPMFHIKKKTRTRYGGNTSSVLYNNVHRAGWKTMPQVSREAKARIFAAPPCPVTNSDSLDAAKWADPRAKKKNKIPGSARNLLPLNWWERHMDFFGELIHNFNLCGVVDLFGSSNLAKACVYATPPRPYLCLVRNEEHGAMLADAVDTFIMREMGRSGPPPSKFFVKEMADIVAKYLPPIEKDVEDSDAGSDSPEEE